MQIKEIRELVRLVSQSGLSVFELENDGFRIRMEGGAVKQAATAVSTEYMDQDFETTETSVEYTPVQEVKAAPTGKPVKAPLVGVYYAAPSPDKDDFVKVGDRVSKGDVLCIIEAMKVMNEITAEQDGVVTGILVENEQLVEYGQDLFMIG